MAEDDKLRTRAAVLAARVAKAAPDGYTLTAKWAVPIKAAGISVE